MMNVVKLKYIKTKYSCQYIL